jgi:23S rRNA pseudouridine2604 synthase
MSKPVRLSKRMSELGLASRREADEWIERGWVRVDGAPAVLGQKVTEANVIAIDRAASAEQAERVTILVNKPIGYVSGQAEDGYEPAVVLIKPENRWNEDRSPIKFQRSQLKSLVPAGRLDIDSTGMLILTQDGRVAKTLIGENSPIEKEYLVRVQSMRGGRLPDSDLRLLNHGLSLEGQALKPAKVWWQNEDQLRFILREGKKRQIRRMCELVGLHVVALKRIRIGEVLLGDLPIGAWRYLGERETF